MAVNHNSGRIVVDIDSELKMALHAALASKGMSLKQWFSRVAMEFVAEHRQPRLAFGESARLVAESEAEGSHGHLKNSGME